MRTYEKGRPTNGWKRGEKITAIAQVKVGDILIKLSQQFEAENLVRVTEVRPKLQSFAYVYCDHRTGEKLDGQEMATAMLFGDEYYRAKGKIKRQAPPPMPAWLLTH